MAVKYFTRIRDARKAANIIENETGYPVSWFLDGRSYRIQVNELGSERMNEILEERLAPECT